jgi:hypothetical protein
MRNRGILGSDGYEPLAVNVSVQRAGINEKIHR